MQNDWWGATPSIWNFWSKWSRWSVIGYFRFVFARSTSAVTAKKVLHLTLIGSPLRAFQWAKDDHRTLSLSPRKGPQKRKVSNIWTISCDNSETVHEIGCQLLLITNRKSHTGFQLVPTSITLNDLERRNDPYFAFILPNSIALHAHYVTVVGNRPIMSVKYCLSVQVFQN